MGRASLHPGGDGLGHSRTTGSDWEDRNGGGDRTLGPGRDVRADAGGSDTRWAQYWPLITKYEPRMSLSASTSGAQT